MTDTLQGTRVEPWDGRILAPGEYARDHSGRWYGAAPDGQLCGLANHQITEHEDGTITASPSIRVRTLDTEWHGYLERGVWRTV